MIDHVSYMYAHGHSIYTLYTLYIHSIYTLININ